ncbi:glycoside hydrolase family 2 TIM barrel-domain containing protein [Stakelama saccharophila]|uniref:Glycoside hydrolase family 2 TIM barrel-domain containing protein n=1 Tax=Stakelama saccharophila TaxID=3075605 RepID=A0ABZ0B4S5_9SPHN|nr:glycoside hydrolase family 2 TIM barrel-domain containing protein [Stakelama sp. W311]WNO52387.1 glycoside hydrolase family 2 TIM barrel-domain containing protein [Stakelama sp. W311]
MNLRPKSPHRRHFPRFFCWLLVLTALGAVARPASAEASHTHTAPGRVAQNLSDGWRFHLGQPEADPRAAGFDDRRWQRVSVPHNWNRIGNYDETRRSDADTTRGIGWYRLRFTAPPADGRRAYLQFDAASIIADVWLNGEKLGRHEGAFSRFRLDATDALREGDNVLAVRVDNSAPDPGSATANIVPISGDFFMYGGLYRPVSLIRVGQAHVELQDYGSAGVYERVLALDDRSARVAVRTELRNDAKRDGVFRLVTTIRDASGRAVASDRQDVSLAAGAARSVSAELSIADPRRWDGRRDPYLYRTTVELRDPSGALLDRVEQPLGLRTIRVDADKGFFLNDRHVELHGVTRHQDRLDKGWALSRNDHAEDMRLIEELGANTIRLSHYNQAQPFYDLADRHGMILWAELGLVNLTAPKGEKDMPPAMMASARRQLKELIRQNYNHPSVGFWSIGNEVTNWSSKGLTPKGGARAAMEALDRVAKAEDATRPTTLAVCCEPLPGEIDKGQERTSGSADTVGYNLYLGWYSTGHVEDAARLGDVMGGLHAEHPGLPIGVGEYGGGGAVTQHTDNVRGGKLESISRPQPEEAEAAIHELSWKALEPLDFLWGSYVWQMFDSTSDLRQEGDSSDINTKGLVTFDRKTKKDAYYFYQAAWRTDAPILHLAERHYVDRAYRTVDVRAYSNAARAELTLNDRAIGSARCADHVCVWPKVRLAMGVNRLRASAERDGRIATDAIAWTYDGPERALHVRAGTLTGVRLANGTRYGSDNYFDGGTGHTLNPFKRELYAGDGSNTNPPKKVVGTETPELYASWRAAQRFGYDLPVPDGEYRVVIHLFEPEGLKPGERVFSVTASGGETRRGIDPARLAGGTLRAATIRMTGAARNGVLRLDFAADRGEALVSAIDVLPRD